MLNGATAPESIDELLAAYSADAARSGPLLPLAGLITRLREPLRPAPFWAGLGNGLLRAGFAEPAAALLAAAQQHYPADAELHYLRGNALRVAQRAEDAEGELRAALRCAPGHRGAALSLAFLLREQGRIEAAGDALAGQWRAGRGDAAQALEAIEFLRGCGALRQARAIADSALAAAPGHARLANAAAELALAFGDFENARARFRVALAHDRSLASAWLRLSYCGRCDNREDPDLQALRDAWNDAALDAASRTCAGFGLGKLLDDLDDVAGASTVLRAANGMARTQSPWRDDAWRALIATQSARPQLPALEPVDGFTPLFVVGLPRTGTTLVASRLAERGGVRDRGELNWVGAMHEHLASQDALASRDALATVAALIVRQMRRDDAPAPVYLDKNPLNFRYLNLILALFPNARIVHCRRDVRDTALSLWSQHFAHPDLAFAYDFDAIAAVARLHGQFMQLWRATFPHAILDVDYEDLVANADAEIARIAAFAGLGPQPSGAAEGTAGAITTASVWQVRQPVHSRAVGRWRRYASFLPELAGFDEPGR